MIFSKKMSFSDFSGKIFYLLLRVAEKNKPYCSRFFCHYGG